MIPAYFGGILCLSGVNILEISVPSVVMRVWWKPGIELEQIHAIAEEIFRDAARIGSINIVFEQEDKTVGIVVLRRDDFEMFCGGHLSALEWAKSVVTIKVHKDFAVVRAGI